MTQLPSTGRSMQARRRLHLGVRIGLSALVLLLLGNMLGLPPLRIAAVLPVMIISSGLVSRLMKAKANTASTSSHSQDEYPRTLRTRLLLVSILISLSLLMLSLR